MLTFKRKLILTQAQAKRLDSWFGVCRMVYNMCIDIRKEGWKNQQRTVHRFELDAQIKDIRDVDWVADVPFDGISESIHRMDLAFKNFFNGKGFPKYRNKGSHNSITVRNCCYSRENAVKIPKIGWVKTHRDSLVYGNIKAVTVKKEPGGYYAYIITDAMKSIQNQDDSQILALDMGTKRFYTDQFGYYCANPSHFKAYENKLRVESRSLSRKNKFGKNWVKQVKRVRKNHTKISSVRKDFLHKESTRIAKAYHYVILEDLNVIGMSKGNLAKQILDAGWGQFRQMLAYKTTVIPVSPKFTSQICSYCGHKDKESRISQSRFVCTGCGIEQNADQNAAKNILGRGTAIISQRKARA